MKKSINWGILGTGWIAAKFVEDLKLVPNASAMAVASRRSFTAQAFASQANIPKAYGSYQELLSDADIDIIFVATPHTCHREDCILALEAGKAVLCEKPFAMTAQEAREVVNVARKRRLFCMEAMWMRFLPMALEVREMIHRGEIGDIRYLSADFGYPTEFDPDNRFFSIERGGGALLDRGVYPLSLAFFLLGSPSHISGYTQIGKTGVDEQSVINLGYDSGAVAILSSSLKAYGSNTATIIGTRGKIIITAPFCRPEKIMITRFSEDPVVLSSHEHVFPVSFKQKLKARIKANPLLRHLNLLRKDKMSQKINASIGNGYVHEAIDVTQCLINGKLESEIMPLDESIEILQVIDQVRSLKPYEFFMAVPENDEKTEA